MVDGLAQRRQDAKVGKERSISWKEGEKGPAMKKNEVAKVIVDAAVKVHRTLGPGLLESVYEAVLAHELRCRGMKVVRQVPIPIVYDGLQFDEGFRADLVVEDLVIVELKSVDAIHAVHAKQLTTQLRLSGKRLGLLLNFGAYLLKDNIRRLVNGLPDDEDLSVTL